jgi:hypothetical protein
MVSDGTKRDSIRLDDMVANQEESKAPEPPAKKPNPKKPKAKVEEAKREDQEVRSEDFDAHIIASLKGTIQAYNAGTLTLRQIQEFSIDHAKELRKATDVTDLPGKKTNQEAMDQLRKLLDIRINAPVPRLVQQDDHGRKWTIQASEGQSYTYLNIGDIYKIQLNTGQNYEGEFKGTLETK